MSSVAPERPLLAAVALWVALAVAGATFMSVFTARDSIVYTFDLLLSLIWTDLNLEFEHAYRIETIAQIIEQQMKETFDWAFAAALSTILIIVTTTLYIIYQKVMSVERIYEGKA